MKIDQANIMRFADYGYNLPEDGLYVTEEFYQQHPEAVRKLARASIRGWKEPTSTGKKPLISSWKW